MRKMSSDRCFMFFKEGFRRPITGNRRGSLLLEAVLSTVILAVSLTLIIQSLTASLRTIVYSAEYTLAISFLENKMFDLVKQGSIDTDLSETEQLAAPNDKYSLLLETKSLEIDGQPSQLNEVELTVFWKSGNRSNHVSLKTILYAPIQKNKI